MPNYELLKDAYAIIGGIPEHAFKLRTVVDSVGESLECGTIACAAGWLCLHPTFAQAIKPKLQVFDSGHAWMTWQDGALNYTEYAEAMSTLFDMPLFDAKSLFIFRGGSCFDDVSMRDKTDKELFLHRVRSYLAEHNQLSTPTPA